MSLKISNENQINLFLNIKCLPLYQVKKTSRFKRRSELSVTSDDNPRQVYVIHLSAVLLNPRDCPQLVDFILDKPVIMVEIGVMINKKGKSCGPKKVIMDPEIDWDGLDITQQGDDQAWACV